MKRSKAGRETKFICGDGNSLPAESVKGKDSQQPKSSSRRELSLPADKRLLWILDKWEGLI